jgi:hypothetical protein
MDRHSHRNRDADRNSDGDAYCDRKLDTDSD